MRDGKTFHGISVTGRGAFTNDEHHGITYAGQHKDGYACGLGMLTSPNGSQEGNREYAEHGPDGNFDGRHIGRFFFMFFGYESYCLYERGKKKEHAMKYVTGHCQYNGENCAPDDPRLLSLIAQDLRRSPRSR